MKKRLTKKQNDVLDDLFKGDKSEIRVLKKHRIKTSLYKKWFLDDELFAEEFAFRIEAGKRQCELLIANHAPFAAAKLIELTEGQKEETVRKACLDVISLPLTLTKQIGKKHSDKNETEVSPATAAKILEMLAEDKGNKT